MLSHNCSRSRSLDAKVVRQQTGHRSDALLACRRVTDQTKGSVSTIIAAQLLKRIKLGHSMGSSGIVPTNRPWELINSRRKKEDIKYNINLNSQIQLVLVVSEGYVTMNL